MTKAELVRQQISDICYSIVDNCPLSRESIVDAEGYVFLSPQENSMCEYSVLIHDKWHILTGSFYKPCSQYQLREQMEYRVTCHALSESVPYDELRNLLRAGYSVQEIAEMLDVPERDVLSAYLMYKERYGYIA